MKLLDRTLFFLLILTLSCARQTSFHSRYVTGETGIRGTVLDAKTSEPLPARIVLRDSARVHSSYYKIYPGHFTAEDGTFFIKAQPGSYRLEIYHGIDYCSEKRVVETRADQTLEITARLEPWVRLRQLGWVNGDGHAHLYTDVEKNEQMLTTVRQICRAQGVDFISTNQDWAGYGDDDWQSGYAPFSDAHFQLYYGAEMPKYRTGHTWWLGLTSTRGYFKASMDTMYENHYYQSERNEHWDFQRIGFPNIPDVYLVPRFKIADHAVACLPHPTSWWQQKRGEIEKYTTNVCAYLSYSLLAGGIWDGLVIMGYNADHYFYQNLWFHILNEGHRLTPLAELDGGYGENNKFPYGLYRVYYQVGDDPSIKNIVNAVRKGRTFVTAGPIVFASVDDYQVGDDLPADGGERTLSIDAYASGDTDDYLSYIIIFRNGKIFKLWDVRAERLRHVEKSLTIAEEERAWYVVKVYGARAHDPEHLDVMSVCEQVADGSFAGALDSEAAVCLTSPFYFWPEQMRPPAPLVADVELTLIDPNSRDVIDEAAIFLLQHDDTLASIDVAGGQAKFKMPIDALLRIEASGYPTLYRGLYLDYEPHLRLIESFTNGDWLERNGWRDILTPGQVPWEAFQYEQTKEILSKVNWTIEMKANERDDLWEDFAALFERKE